MKKHPLAAVKAILWAAIILCPLSLSMAADPQAATAAKADSDLEAQVEKLQDKVDTMVDQGKKSESDYADVLKECDALLAAHKGETSEALANVLALKVDLYSQLFDNDEKAIELLKQARNDFPDTVLGMRAGRLIKELTRDAEDKKIQKTLVAGVDFPDFSVKDLDGKALSAGNYKGKVVLVDFWATWCEPCVMELPDVIKTYEKYHDKGFEIIGVSLDIDQDSLTSFIKEKKMPWAEYYDGLRFDNKLARKYGVSGIPTNILVGKDGRIIDKDLRGQALEDAVGKALGQ